MGITDKFGNFQIKKSDRISQEDQAWLTHREELYKRAIAVYKSVYDIYKAENESYSEEDRKNYKYSSFLVGNFGVPKSLSDVQNSYISGIFSYFQISIMCNLKTILIDMIWIENITDTMTQILSKSLLLTSSTTMQCLTKFLTS